VQHPESDAVFAACRASFRECTSSLLSAWVVGLLLPQLPVVGGPVVSGRVLSVGREPVAEAAVICRRWCRGMGKLLDPLGQSLMKRVVPPLAAAERRPNTLSIPP